MPTLREKLPAFAASGSGRGTVLGGIFAALIAFVLLVPLFASAAGAAEPVAWADKPWRITAAAGDRTTEKSSLTAKVGITKPELELSSELAKVASLKYDEVGELLSGRKLNFSLVVRPDRLESNETFRGEIRLFGRLQSTDGMAVLLPADASDSEAAAGRELISKLSVTIRTVISPDKTEVTVLTSIDVAAEKGGKGVQIYVDGKRIGETNSKGELKILVKAGERRLSALMPGLVGGFALVDLDGGRRTTVRINMTGEGMAEVVEYETTSPQLPVLPADSEGFDVSFLNNKGQTIALKELGLLTFDRPNGGSTISVDATERFKIGKGGVIKLIPGQPLGDITTGDGVHRMFIAATSKDGFTLQDEVEFYVGRFTIAGQLAAPPSAPKLDLSGITVKLTVLGTGITMKAKANKDGAFSFTDVPLGNLALAAETTSKGSTFSSDGSLFLNADRSVTMTLLGPEDIINGVPPITIVSADSPAAATSPARARADAEARSKVAAAAAIPTPQAEKSVSVSVTASTQNFRVQNSAQLTVPKGTSTLKLTYETQTVEYPFYVLSQSIFNDVWDLFIIADNGSKVFSITRNVNSQLFVDPIWIAGGIGGTTGKITKSFDISKFTKNSNATFTLSASATNIGDSALTTTVNATIERDKGFIVEVVKTYSDVEGPNFSIPRSGKKNTFAKGFTLKIKAPKDTKVGDIKKIEAKALLGAGASTGPIIFDGKPEKLNDKNFRVQTTFGGAKNPLASPISGVPPAAHFVAYAFTVTADIDGKDETAEVVSGRTIALWKMPDGFARYGSRDQGGDDWASFGTYAWMQGAAALLPKIDDISGEHGRNIGHATHKDGTDLDILHFGQALSATSGTSNFLEAQKLAVKAAKGNEAAGETLATWIQAQRDGLAALAADGTVLKLFTMPGAADAQGVLASNWAWTLLRDGRYKAKVTDPETGQTTTKNVVLLAAATLSDKIKPLAGHNSHHHVALDPAALQKP